MGRTNEQGKGSRSVAEELSDLLGIELDSQPTTSEAWDTEAEAEAQLKAEEESYVQAEEAATYAEEQRLTAFSLELQGPDVHAKYEY